MTANRSASRVVTFTTRYPLYHPGGVESVTRRLLEALGSIDSGWSERHVSAFRGRRGIARVPLAGDFVASVILAIRGFRKGTAVLVVNGAEYAWAPVLLGRLLRRPVVVVWHGVRGAEAVPTPPGAAGRIAVRVFRAGSDWLQGQGLHGTRTVAVSPVVAREIERRFTRRVSTQVIPNGLPKEFSASRRSQCRRPDDRLRVMWIGTSPYQKGLSTAVEACRLARARGVDVRLTVVGLTESGTSESWIDWLGFVSPVAVEEMWMEQDVFLSPTRYEAFGLAALEAMAAGVPVVCSSALEWVVGGAGEVVRSGETDDYAEAIVKLVDADYQTELSRRGRERALQFSLEESASSYLVELDTVT